MLLPQKDLRIHDAGVKIMRELYPHLVDSNDRFKVTHVDSQNRLYIRQKTDLYPFVNIFLEEYSMYQQGKIGGPFQAYEDGCNSFCYYYPREGRIIWTKLDNKTIQMLWDLIQRYRFNHHRTKYISNAGYHTKGYTIPVWDYINWMGKDCQLVEVPARSIT